MVAGVADSLEFEHKYTWVVIAWAPEDRPTDAQVDAVLDEFDKTAWAGLEPDRYSSRRPGAGQGAAARSHATRCVPFRPIRQRRPDETVERPADARLAPLPGGQPGHFLCICGGCGPTMHWLST